MLRQATEEIMATELHWVDGPWRGRLALAARPRGGEWLEDEMKAWRRDRVDMVVSLLEPEEENELGLAREGEAAREQAMEFCSIPLADRQVPPSRVAFASALEMLDRDLAKGKNLVVHCRQGIGRTGLVAACLLLGRGIDATVALRRLSIARGTSVPETVEQRRWIEDFADVSLSAR